MSTLTTYRTATKLKGFDALSDTIVDAAVQEARRRVFMARRWSWLEASNASLATAVNDPDVSLTSITDLAHIDAVRLSNASGPIDCRYRPRTFIRDLQDRWGTTGYYNADGTFFWTRVASTILFWPAPQQVLTVTVEYAKAAADLAASPTVDIIPDKNQDLVVWAAVVPLSFRQRGMQESSAADQYFSKVLLPLHAGQDGIEQRQTSEQVRTGWWGC